MMLSKTHLTSHSRMSSSKWEITPLWSSGSWGSFFYCSSVYSCHLFLISSASVRSIPFLSFIKPIFALHVPFVYLIFLKRSQVFPILLLSPICRHAKPGCQVLGPPDVSGTCFFHHQLNPYLETQGSPARGAIRTSYQSCVPWRLWTSNFGNEAEAVGALLLSQKKRG